MEKLKKKLRYWLWMKYFVLFYVEGNKSSPRHGAIGSMTTENDVIKTEKYLLLVKY